MSCITRVPIPSGHRRLTRIALEARLEVLETRFAELCDLVPYWIARGLGTPAAQVVPPGTD